MLADRLVKPGGRIALVLPVTALSGESWREVRQMLASRYEVEFVVSSHDPNLLSMSYDTALVGYISATVRYLQERGSRSR